MQYQALVYQMIYRLFSFAAGASCMYVLKS